MMTRTKAIPATPPTMPPTICVCCGVRGAMPPPPPEPSSLLEEEDGLDLVSVAAIAPLLLYAEPPVIVPVASAGVYVSVTPSPNTYVLESELKSEDEASPSSELVPVEAVL